MTDTTQAAELWQLKHAADTALLAIMNLAERRYPFEKRVGVFLKHGQVNPSPATVYRVHVGASQWDAIPRASVIVRVRLERTGTYRDVHEEQIVEL